MTNLSLVSNFVGRSQIDHEIMNISRMPLTLLNY